MTQDKAIVKYILQEVLELDDDISTKIIEEHQYNTVLKLSRLSERALSKLRKDAVIKENDVDMLNTFTEWYSGMKSRGILLPATLEQWKERLTSLNVDEYSYDTPTTRSNEPEAEAEAEAKRPELQRFPLDYPIIRCLMVIKAPGSFLNGRSPRLPC